MIGELSERERWLLIQRGRLRLLTPDERDQLLQWLPLSDPGVFTFLSRRIEVAEVQQILGRATAPVGRG